ncbi:MAG: GGDEF domain-containing protein [Pseudomonadota bacterium]|nr:GGDEF domain-containing protein [Pseudomonadota bacterium]
MVKHYLWLVLLSGFAIWSSMQIATWPVSWQTLLFYAPYAVAGIGIFISVLLNRMQPILMLLTVAITVFALTFVPIEHKAFSVDILYPLISILLPLNILIWLLVPERGVKHNTYNIALLSLFVIQALGVYWVVQTMPFELMQHISTPVTDEEGFWVKIPLLGSLLMILVANVLVIRLAMLQKFKVLDQVGFFVLVLMVLGLNGYVDYGVLGWLASISLLMIILSMIFDAHQIAYTDELTGMAGRRALFESFMGLGRTYSIAMVDIDHFKQFNDSYGHDIGDLVLRTVSKVLNSVGSGGKAYRFGGEEFTVVFAGKNPEQVRPILDELRKAVEETELNFTHEGKDTNTTVRVSIGVAEKGGEFKTPEEVIKGADQALYQAKEMGRNRVVVFGDPVEKTIKKGQKSVRLRKRKPKAKPKQ